MKKNYFFRCLLAMVFAVSSFVSYGASITIVPNGATTGSGASSYVSTDVSFSVSSIGFIINNYNPSTRQVRGNQSTVSKNFYLYNTAALPGLVRKITMNMTGNTIIPNKISLITDTAPITDTAGGTKGTGSGKTNTVSWDVTGELSYFRIQFSNGGTSGSAICSEIIIEYEEVTSDPSIYTTPGSLTDFAADLITPATQTITVNGKNLKGNISLGITGNDAAQFSVTPESLIPVDGTVANAEVTISYSPAAVGTHAATLEISSTDATSVTYNLAGAAVLPKLDKPVTTEASGVNTTTFTAMWNAVNNASEYQLNVYRKRGTPEIVHLEQTFDMCKGDGGNDGVWSAITTTTDFPATLITAGWKIATVYSASGCVRFGTGKNQGSLSLPVLGSLSGETDLTLTFKAGAWESTDESTTLLLSIDGGGTLSAESVEMVKGQFKDYSIRITGATPLTVITFKGRQAANSRFFLDDIRIFAGGPIYSHITGSPFTISDGTATSYDVTGLTPNADYEYSLVAKAPNFIDSDESDRIAVTTQGMVSVEGVDTEVNKVIGKTGEILIQTFESADITIYHMTGLVLDSRKAVEGEFTVPVSSGIYLVKVGNVTKKIIVK